MNDSLFIALQYLLPHHLLSRLVGCLASTRQPWIKDAFIQRFASRYRVDMAEALEPDLRAYESFNAFFTRALKPGARPLAEGDDVVLCPADGAISEIGRIEDGRLLQAKGHTFSLLQLVGGDTDVADRFQGGHFATVYLSPKDYHRVHMPLGGELESMTYVPGALFSVNQTTADNVEGLFARNERLVCLFQTSAGPMAVILVGAMIVAGIETVWAGPVAPLRRRVSSTRYGSHSTPVQLDKGAEMGRFMLGSTAIVLFPPDTVEWQSELRNGSQVRMGQAMGSLLARAAKPRRKRSAKTTESDAGSESAE